MGGLESLLSLATTYTIHGAESRLVLLTRMRISLKMLTRSWQHPIPADALSQRSAHFDTVVKILYEDPLLIEADILEDMIDLAIELDARGQSAFELETDRDQSSLAPLAVDKRIGRCLAEVERKLRMSRRWLPKYRLAIMLLTLAIFAAASFAAGIFWCSKFSRLV